MFYQNHPCWGYSQFEALIKHQQQLTASLMEELLGAMNDMLGGVLDPATIMQLMRNYGIDVSQLSGMVGQHPGLDP
jgi:hypothetical protein